MLVVNARTTAASRGRRWHLLRLNPYMIITTALLLLVAASAHEAAAATTTTVHLRQDEAATTSNVVEDSSHSSSTTTTTTTISISTTSTTTTRANPNSNIQHDIAIDEEGEGDDMALSTTAIIIISVCVAIVVCVLIFVCGFAMVLLMCVSTTLRKKKKKKAKDKHHHHRHHDGSKKKKKKINKSNTDGIEIGNMVLIDMTAETRAERKAREARINATAGLDSEAYTRAYEREYDVKPFENAGGRGGRGRGRGDAGDGDGDGGGGDVRSDASEKILHWEVKPKDVTVVEKLGRGGFGTVFKAIYNDEHVALKKFDLEGLSDCQLKTLITQYENEVEILAALRHPNILGFRGAILEMPDIGIMTEFMEYGSYYELLFKRKDRKAQKRGAPRVSMLLWSQKLKILHDVAKGQQYLHRMNVIHRDLKSQNILLCDSTSRNLSLDSNYQNLKTVNFMAKIADFGLSKVKETRSLTHTRNVGTSLWMAPEVAQGTKYGNACDVYSFGMVMYETLCERLPFYDAPPKLRIVLKVASDPEFRPTIKPAIHEDAHDATEESFINLMKKCWNYTPEERPTFVEIVQEVAAILEAHERALLSSAAAAASASASTPPHNLLS